MLRTDYSIHYAVYGSVINQMAEEINDLAANGGGGGGGAVASVNGKTGEVVLAFQDLLSSGGETLGVGYLLLADSDDPEQVTVTASVGPGGMLVRDLGSGEVSRLGSGGLWLVANGKQGRLVAPANPVSSSVDIILPDNPGTLALDSNINFVATFESSLQPA